MTSLTKKEYALAGGGGLIGGGLAANEYGADIANLAPDSLATASAGISGQIAEILAELNAFLLPEVASEATAGIAGAAAPFAAPIVSAALGYKASKWLIEKYGPRTDGKLGTLMKYLGLATGTVIGGTIGTVAESTLAPLILAYLTVKFGNKGAKRVTSTILPPIKNAVRGVKNIPRDMKNGWSQGDTWKHALAA